MKHVAFLDNPL